MVEGTETGLSRRNTTRNTKHDITAVDWIEEKVMRNNREILPPQTGVAGQGLAKRPYDSEE